MGLYSLGAPFSISMLFSVFQFLSSGLLMTMRLFSRQYSALPGKLGNWKSFVLFCLAF